jgi:hypothetical protein
MAIILKDDVSLTKIKNQKTTYENEQKKNLSFFERYIMLRQKSSKLLKVWEIVWFLVLLASFGLVPYT